MPQNNNINDCTKSNNYNKYIILAHFQRLKQNISWKKKTSKIHKTTELKSKFYIINQKIAHLQICNRSVTTETKKEQLIIQRSEAQISFVRRLVFTLTLTHGKFWRCVSYMKWISSMRNRAFLGRAMPFSAVSHLYDVGWRRRLTP